MAKQQQRSAPPARGGGGKQSNGGNGGSGGSSGADLMTKKLAAMRERWEELKEESKKPASGTTLTSSPSGKRHICALTVAKIVENDKGIAVVTEWTAVQGDEIGEKAVIWFNFDTDDRMIWAQRDLRKLGKEVDDLDITQLPQICKELITERPTARLTVKENGAYVNVYIDKLVTVDEIEGEGGQRGGDQSDPEAVGGDGSVEGNNEMPEIISVGDDVAYTIKGRSQTGVVKAVKDDDTVDIRNDDTKKIENVDIIKVKLLAEVGDE